MKYTNIIEDTTNAVYPPTSTEPRTCHDCGEVLSEVPYAYFTQCQKCMRDNHE
ncbi:protein YhfH [Natribacillus halophilus]|uniref:YhfH-like protein n=1 Tax=Natribacillus halophilus TaxID=549003 RepID=A0A1G8LWQ7_9BACI|nr:protein YhfH [Natribacillus halophilus]SDI60119.1 YhfH-like protein [Natribacillus halophilus]